MSPDHGLNDDLLRLVHRWHFRCWSNYFRMGTVVAAYEVVMGHARRRLRRWLCVKHKVRRGDYARFHNERLHGELGLYLIPRLTHGLSRAKP